MPAVAPWRGSDRLPFYIRDISARLTLEDGREAIVYRAWWWRPYAALLVLLCRLMSTEPDGVKLGRMVERAIKVHIRPAKRKEPGEAGSKGGRSGR